MHNPKLSNMRSVLLLTVYPPYSRPIYACIPLSSAIGSIPVVTPSHMSRHTRPVAAHSTHPGLVRPFAGTRNHPPNILPLHLQSVHDTCPSVHNAQPQSTQILHRYMHLSSIPIPYIRPALCKCSFRLNIDSASIPHNFATSLTLSLISL